MFQELRASLGLFLFLFLVTGVAYPLCVTFLGQALFPYQAHGSLVVDAGKIVGSALIGQAFSGEAYFHSRPSYAGNGYDAANSSGSNLAPTSSNFIAAVTERVEKLRLDDAVRSIPVDLVTASGSGLDPDISVDAARFQAARIAKVRSLPLAEVERLIVAHITPRTFGFLGEKRINVLALNQALDTLSSPSSPAAETP
ncbi:MAG: potassium-transporting ATPase subunit KdpC [Alphaproteobacteria bacterium]|nr:potassium-transporting ATPase subunit KdpC [Alphaproteobacteria bacterium]